MADDMAGAGVGNPGAAAPPPAMNWYLELRKVEAPSFDGRTDPLVAEEWIKQMEILFEAMFIPRAGWVSIASAFLTSRARAWYATVKATYMTADGGMDWDVFKQHFNKNYFPAPFRARKQREFYELKQDKMTVMDYANKFLELCPFVPTVATDEEGKTGRFEAGLNNEIKYSLAGQTSTSYQEAFEKALRAEEVISSISPRPSVRDSEPQSGIKRKGDYPSSVEESTSHPSKKPFVTASANPECPECHKRHPGPCRAGLCFKCGKSGHIANKCPSLSLCYNCGRPGHLAKDCQNPKKQDSGAPKPGATARLFALDALLPENDDKVVKGSGGQPL